MKKTSIVIGIGLLGAVLSLTLLPAAAAQEVGDGLVILVPAGKVQNVNQILVVTGRAKATTKVGTCKTGDFKAQDVNIVDTDGQKVLGTSEVIVIDYGYRNDPVPFKGVELAVGTRLGSGRNAGLCGPGWEAFTQHVLPQGNVAP